PIPRTLQLSLIGVRSLSQIQTPPNNRMPVQTYVIEKSETLMREVIQRELARNGQVFYLHNNTQTIYQAAKRIQQLVPQATIAVAHGKMAKEEMEDVMIRFTENEYNILVCTTIIETGIDIPNANTILVDYADRFGLSQLYQIKGRVGRSDRLAYAYLMYDANQNLSETASKRLNAIKDFTELGSGYKIAMRDLAIRGAGDLLGAKQAGFINTVGMDLYIEMLHDAIARKRGLPVENHEAVQKKASIKVDGYVPEKYAPEDYEKIRLYQRIEKAKTVQELAALEQEITDCYGQNPKSVQLLFDKRRMEVLVDTPKISRFEETKTEALLYLSPLWAQDIDGMDLFMKLTDYSRDVKFKQEKGVLQLRVSKKLDWIKMCCDIVELLDTVKRK
ncbi:MAG: transcription-repair coupling factor, partial [Erysipelotrichaceae bacterium]|nr:transcription-repair coupling factor [Erysipelotrichaceae bacterium]